MSHTFFPSRKVITVNNQDEVLGEMDIYQAHSYPMQLHRAISVWLVNSRDKVLLQQRSAQKVVGAGVWANAVCGNVIPGESYKECAYRRLKEELGITKVKIKPLYKFAYKAYGNKKYGEHEVDQVFVGEYDGDTKLNPQEVSEVIWLDLEKLKKAVGNSKEKVISPEESLVLGKNKLKAKTPFVKIKVKNKSLSLAPWTVMMLQDYSLHDFR